MKRITAFMVCLFLSCLVVLSGALAENDRMRLLRADPLSFSKQPISIDSVASMPDGSLAVIYFAAGSEEVQREYRLDLFAPDGVPLLSKSFGQFNIELDPYPFAQIILQSDGFLCEYYPDITSMETCFQTAYGNAGKATGKEQKKKLPYGTAAYAERVGGYMVKKQAHAADERDASPYQAVEIVHIATGQSTLRSLYGWSDFCAFPDGDGDLLIAQKNERGSLEIRQYGLADGLKETVIELDGAWPAVDDHARVQSAACIGRTAYLQIYLTNQESLILICDLEQEAIVGSSPLSAAEGSDYIAALRTADSMLLAVDGHWDETAQRHLFRLDALDSDLARTPLALAHGSCLYLFTEDEPGIITTIERGDSPASYVVCRYAVQ